MATLHLMCGLPCSGKSTLARRLEKERSALRLTPDEWHVRLFGQDVQEEAHDERHDLIETLLWEVAGRALELGVDVILDFGFWSRDEREQFRRRAADLGAASELHYLEVPPEVLLQRLALRNAALPADTFRIDEGQLEMWIGTFQFPAGEELERREAPARGSQEGSAR